MTDDVQFSGTGRRGAGSGPRRNRTAKAEPAGGRSVEALDPGGAGPGAGAEGEGRGRAWRFENGGARHPPRRGSVSALRPARGLGRGRPVPGDGQPGWQGRGGAAGAAGQVQPYRGRAAREEAEPAGEVQRLGAAWRVGLPLPARLVRSSPARGLRRRPEDSLSPSGQAPRPERAPGAQRDRAGEAPGTRVVGGAGGGRRGVGRCPAGTRGRSRPALRPPPRFLLPAPRPSPPAPCRAPPPPQVPASSPPLPPARAPPRAPRSPFPSGSPRPGAPWLSLGSRPRCSPQGSPPP